MALKIDGTQQEILSTVFRDVTLSNLEQITLPIDGISVTNGSYLIQSCPNLKRLKVAGLFNTYFMIEESKLMSLTMKEKCSTTTFLSRENLHQVMLHEKRREFLKVISLMHLQPLRMEIRLSDSYINSRCIRAVYARYPDLEHLVLVSNSVKESSVSLCGIPYRLCKKMAQCESFTVLYPNQVKVLTSIAHLKKLKSLELTILDDVPTAELTLLFIMYGICEVSTLEQLSLNNFKMSDVALMVLAQRLTLLHCKLNGSEERWIQFQSVFKNHAIKSFLLPLPLDFNIPCSPGQVVSSDVKILKKIFGYLESRDIFEARKVCNQWRFVISDYLHQTCSSDGQFITDLEKKLTSYERGCPPSPSHSSVYYLGETLRDTPAFVKVLKIWSSMTKETTLAAVSLGRSSLECFQRDFRQASRIKPVSCQKRRQLEYWYYPDGSDDLIYCEQRIESTDSLKDALNKIDTLLIIGCWGKKDNGISKFLNPSRSVTSIHLIGLQENALNLVLPRLTVMMNLESLLIKPWSLVNCSPYCDITKTHLQILCNSSFKLKHLTIQSHAPSEAVVEFVRSQRFTLESVELQSNVNISDRLTFSMPQLKVLQLDEPPGCLLWTTLNVHSSLETINFGRSGCAYNQVKNKSPSKVDPFDTDSELSATEISCDVNWFLENAGNRRMGVQKSILQQGTDSALKFFMNFPYLTALTLRNVHAHYGILQGIFKKFTRLKKLTLVNATGVTDEILTGFSKDILDEMDIMNPFQVKCKPKKSTVHGKGASSIRNLKCLTHLSLDDQPLCTDLSIIFGILKLHQLEYLSCKKWKITDVTLRALRDILPSLKEVNTDGCATVSKYARDYFNEKRTCQRLAEE